MGRHINETPKRHILGQNMLYDVQIVKIGRPMRPVRVTKIPKIKKERQRQKPNSGKLGIRRDHPRRRIDVEFCLVGGLREVVVSFKFHQKLLSGIGDHKTTHGAARRGTARFVLR